MVGRHTHVPCHHPLHAGYPCWYAHNACSDDHILIFCLFTLVDSPIPEGVRAMLEITISMLTQFGTLNFFFHIHIYMYNMRFSSDNRRSYHYHPSVHLAWPIRRVRKTSILSEIFWTHFLHVQCYGCLGWSNLHQVRDKINFTCAGMAI
jgi:hypothetical protein